MEFLLLGPLEIRDDEGRRVALPRRQQRTLLSALLIASGSVVSRDALISALWPHSVPPTAHTALQGLVSHLRRLVGPQRLLTQTPGYRLDTSRDTVDASVFESRVRDALEQSDAAARAARLRAAVSLWRGDPLPEFDSEAFARPAIDRLRELYATALEERTAADLELGRAPELVPELEALLAEQPYRERLRALLMLALYRTGRQADALAIYREGRELFVGELGIEPGRELQQLQRRILEQDPALDGVPAAATRRTDLPRGTVTFVFTDIEESTRLLRDVGADAYAAQLARHRRLVREAFAAHGGVEVDTQGDAFFYAFGRASDALAAAARAQAALAGGPIRLRIGIHTGEPLVTDDGYVGVDVHRAARIASIGHGGQILVSQATRAVVDGNGLRELGEHRLKDLETTEHLFQLGEGEFPQLQAAPVRRTNLPLQVTSFVGRARELARITELLETTRLLTLTGAGGTGKTRLAINAGQRLLEQFADGVWFVDLAPLAQPELVPQALATAMELREEPGRPILNVLVGAVGSKRMIIVLDNCEHLVDPCARLADTLVRTCPNVRVLATSRTPLALAGETTLRVPLLEAPDAASLPPFEHLIRYESVRLFADRARAADPDFAVTTENAAAVAHVCARLDGIPLAIELAAARVRQLAVQQIASRLDDRFGLLRGGSRAALPRHRALRALVSWSEDLLNDDERALFRRLSVFSGGWTLEAAEQVCAGAPVARTAILDVLGRLVDASLVVADEQPDGAMRFRLLETLRAYAVERLHESGETDTTEAAHRAYFVELAETLDLQLLSAEQLRAFERMEQEHDNFRAVLATDPTAAASDLVRLASALVVFWNFRNYWTEGSSWLERVLRDDEEPSLASARARAMQGFFRAVLGDPARAEAAFERAQAEASALGTPLALVSVLALIASARFALGRHDDALVRRYLRAAEETGWDWAILFGEILRTWPTIADDPPAAAAAFESMLLRSRAIGERLLIGFCLLGFGLAATALGDHELAVERLQEAVALYREVGHRGQFVAALASLGQALLDDGNCAAAAAAFAEGLGQAVVLGTDPHLPANLGGLACVASAIGSADVAARLLGAVAASRSAAGIGAMPIEQTLEEQALAQTRAVLGNDELERLRADGAHLDLNDAVALAHAVARIAAEAQRTPAR